MASTTPNLGLRKPDGVDLVNVLSDLDANYDILDAEVGKAGAWTAYTPTWAASGTAVVLGNGVVLGRYKKQGKTLQFAIQFTYGSTSTGGTGIWSFSLPPAITTPVAPPALSDQWGVAILAKATASTSGLWQAGSNSGVLLVLTPSAASTNLSYVGPGVPTAWAANDKLSLQGILEIA